MLEKQRLKDVQHSGLPGKLKSHPALQVANTEWVLRTYRGFYGLEFLTHVNAFESRVSYMCIVHKTLVHLSASILENKQTRSISNQLVVITFFFLHQRNPKIDANPH